MPIEGSSRLPAWEREKAIRRESKLRREKLPPSQIHSLDPQAETTSRPASDRAAAIKDKKQSNAAVQPHFVPYDEVPEETDLWPTKKSPPLRSQDNTMAPSNQTKFRAGASAATAPMKAPKVHTLNANNADVRPGDQHTQDCDAWSVASSDTNSDDDEDKLVDSLEFSIVVSPKPKPTVKPPVKSPPPFSTHPQPTTNISAPKRREMPAPSQFKAKVADERAQTKNELPAPPIQKNQLDPSTVASNHHPLHPRQPEEKALKSTKLHGGEVKPIANAMAPRLEAPIEKVPPPSRPAVVASECQPKYPIAAHQTSKPAAKQVRDPKCNIFDQAKPSPIEVVAPPQPVAKPKATLGTCRAITVLSASMEEEQLRREILSLNSKLDKVRFSASHDDDDDDPKNNECSDATSPAYGGGTHHKVGTRTALVDRCSLEKRQQMSGVYQTRVRRGVQVHVPDSGKPSGKKADKVCVKKDLALKMLLS
ncbi:hypothetical protein H310_00520 [Aphanomyces invadans]|uniref:Uncharacterized protein n=1 Tax=Aphanomyces invadans TaxID=157072 RepID=A0A024UW16_9STRA|nr:hypothetical protein H310_00520 [Aphanomyces invadans]ETW10150.1 hypothetical protein H310_00520 [Aphanomyces invadans]|eukprot:XP_008861561.1 hypothetical protein H310_00520 [Aphanomyces invadans]